MSKRSNKSKKTSRGADQGSGRKVNTPQKKRTIRTVKTSAESEAVSREEKTVAPPQGGSRQEELPFGKMNYILLLVGVGIIAIGFFLMSLDDFVDATQFSISLYIAPIVVVVGFLEIIYAIMYQPARKEPVEEAGA